jgi:hypothetical protein
LDLLNEYSISGFQFVQNLDGAFLKEFLDYGLMHPFSVRHILEFLGRNETYVAYFGQVVDLLQSELQEFCLNFLRAFEDLGLTVDRIVWEMSWISQDDFHDLFVPISQDFFKSQFS